MGGRTWALPIKAAWARKAVVGIRPMSAFSRRRTNRVRVEREGGEVVDEVVRGGLVGGWSGPRWRRVVEIGVRERRVKE